jgi:hypothetical protein
MARVVLHDDPPFPYADRGPTGFGTRSAIDQDGRGQPGAEVFPVVTVLVRTRTGFDDDGRPEYSWQPLISEVATVYTAHLETDDPSGESYLTGRAVVLYSGDAKVAETAMVKTSFGDLFRVTKVSQTPDRIEMELDQVINSG